MKKRLKGLLSIWLAAVMLLGMLPVLSTPAMASPSNEIYIYVYDETEPLKIDGNLYDCPRVSVSEGTQLSSLVSPEDGVTLTGWNLWKFENINSGYVITDKLWTKAADYKLTADDISNYANGKYFAFEPVYTPTVICLYTGTEAPVVNESIGNTTDVTVTVGDPLNEQTAIISKLNSGKSLVGWDVWDTGWSSYASGTVWTEEVVSGNPAGWTLSATDLATYSCAADCVFVPIYKDKFTPVLTMDGYTYGQTPSFPSIDQNPGNGTVTYWYWGSDQSGSADAEQWNPADPPVLDAGSYHMQARIAETTEYAACSSEWTNFSVERAAISPELSMSDYTYGETPLSPSVTGNTGSGEVTYWWNTREDWSGCAAWANSKPSSAGTYYMYASVASTTNYRYASTAFVEFKVLPATPTVSPPTAKTNLIYNGSAQTLVDAGGADGGEMQYALGENGTTAPESGWATGIPEGIDAGTYYVWYKAVGAANYKDTDPACVAVLIAPKAQDAPAVSIGYSIDYAAETITIVDGYEIYTATEGGTNVSSGSTVVPGSTLYIRVAAKENHAASEWVEVSIPTRPAHPIVQSVNETVDGRDDGKITGTTAAMEYSANGTEWTDCTGDKITGLSDGTYQVRYKAVNDGENKAFVSETAEVTISTGSKVSVTFVENGGSTVDDRTGLTYNTSVTLPVITRTGYAFGGWSTAPDGTGTTYSAEASMAVTANITLYAQWTANTYTVKFHANGGTGEMTDQSFTYDEAQQLTSNAFIRSGYSFAGWAATENGVAVYVNSQNVRNLTAEDDAVIDLYAVWSAVPVYGISGTVFESDTTTPISGAAVQLKQGSTVLAEVTTDASGNYSIPGVLAGLYNVVAGKDGVTMTIMVEVTDNLTGQNITMPARNTNSVLNVTNDEGAAEFKVVVDGLDQEAAHWGDENQSVASVTITMTVTAEAADQNDTEQEEIRDKAPGATVEFLDITVTKTVDSDTSSLNETNQVLEIVVPYDFSGKINVDVYRKHGAEPAAALIKLSTEPTAPYTDGSFWLDTANGKIHIYTNKFSTYAIGYTVPTSSSGGYTPTYAITVERSENGEVKANRSYASSGATVTITVTPEDGYALYKLTVTDSQGNKIELTDKGDGTFTFKMPGRKVTIEASFVDDGSFSVCPGDHTCPIWPYTDAEATAWYHDGVHYCIENGLMTGYGNGIFKPNADTTRAMITVMLWRLNGSPVVNYLLDFEDVEEGQWYTEAIRWAKSEGIATGYGNGCFGTNDAITREQMVTILWRYAQYKGIDVSVGEDTNILSYNDAFDVAEYAIPAMQWACGSGMVQGMNDPNGEGMILAPESKGTRAQIATMMMRFCTEIVK